MAADEVARRELETLTKSGDYMLFLGAGASVEAGLPTWEAALVSLAEHLRTSGRVEYAALVEAESKAGRFLEAAELFYLAGMTEDENAKAISATFGAAGRISPRLTALARSNFAGVVSTNFDRVFVEAATAANVALVAFSETDDDLDAARACQERMFVRINGRVEVPKSLVLARRQYESLKSRRGYSDFVRWLTQNQNIVFFGFSFADQYLRTLIDAAVSSAGGRFARKAFALLSQKPEPMLAELLNRAAITPIVYSPENRHEEGWRLVTSTQRKDDSPNPQSFVLQRVQRELALVLTRLRVRKDVAIRTGVLGAIMLEPLAAACKTGKCSLHEALVAISRSLGLDRSELHVLRLAAAHLAETKQIELEGEWLLSVATTQPAAGDTTLDQLVKGIVARAQVRYGHKVKDEQATAELLKELLTRILVADGLSLAHGILKRTPIESRNLSVSLSTAIARFAKNERDTLNGMQRAIQDLFCSPNSEEEQLLDLLGAVAFNTCVVVSDPSAIERAEHAVKTPLFLDASIILPWMARGHPSAALYSQIVDGFTHGAGRFPAFYLNEVVSHRRIALEVFREGRLAEPKRLEHLILLEGSNGLNAFLAGFAQAKHEDRELEFDDYLAEVAPFDTEVAAEKFLSAKGLQVVPVNEMISGAERGSARHMQIKALLRSGYQDAGKSRNSITIDHDSLMIHYLMGEAEAGWPPLFVTADRALVKILSESDHADLLRMIVFPYQAACLADLVAAGRSSLRGLSKALWSVRTDRITRMRDFYTTRILREYEPSLLEEIPTIVNSINDAAERLTSTLGGSDGVSDSKGMLKYVTALEQFEPQFYQLMLAARRKHGLAE